MGGKARWRKLRRVVGVEPLGCHAPSRQRFKQDRAKTRDAKTIRDQARADGVEGVEVDVLERMGVTALTESKKASKMKKEQSSPDKIEIEFQDVAVNGTITVHVRADVDDETMGVNGKVEHTEGVKDERHDLGGNGKDHEAFRETEISAPACTDFSDEQSSSLEDESKRTDKNQTSTTKIVHFSNEPAKIIDDDHNEDDSSDTDRTVTPSPCSPNIEEEVREEDQSEGLDEVRTGEGMDEDDDRGRLETIEECQKESYDEANQGQVPDSQDLMGIIDARKKDHGHEAFMLCLNDTTIVIDGLGNGSIEDNDILMPSPEELEEREPDQDEALEFYADDYFLKPSVLDEDETRIQNDLGSAIVDKTEQETPFITTKENTSDQHVHTEGKELGHESEYLKSSDCYYNFKELNISDKPDPFLQSEAKEESVFISNDEVRYTVAPRRTSDPQYDILDDSLPDYCVSKNLSMEVNTTESVKFFLSDSELSDNDYQTRNTDADCNDRIQPEDWVDSMAKDEQKEEENADRQDETDDMTDVVIYDLSDTDDEAPSHMDEDDEQNRTMDGEEEKLKEADENKCDSDTGELDKRKREEGSTYPEVEERCATLTMQHSKEDEENLTKDGQTCTEHQCLLENEYDSPEVLKSSMANYEESKDGKNLDKNDWEASLHENHLEKSHQISEQSQRSTVAEKQIFSENKEDFNREPEIYLGMRHWEARWQRRKLVQSCAVLDEQVFAAYRRNFIPCALSSSTAGKYPVLYKETYENHRQSLISNRQSSTEYKDHPALDRSESDRHQMNSGVERHSSKDDRQSSVMEEQDEEEDKQVSTARRRDSIDDQQNSLTGDQHLDYQQFLRTIRRNSTEGYQKSIEDQPSEEVEQLPTTKEWSPKDDKQYSAMEKEQFSEKYQDISKRRRDATHDIQNLVVKEQHSEAYQQCLTRKRNSLESGHIYRIGEQLSEDYQEVPPTKRRNSMEDQQISVMERKTSIEDQRFPNMSKQKSAEEERYSGLDRQSWEWERQFPERKRQNSVEDQQSSMIERQYTMSYQESPAPIRQTSMEEQQTSLTERQDLLELQQFSVMEKRNSMEEIDNSVQETKYMPRDQREHSTMQNHLTSLDRQVLIDEEQTSTEDKQHSLMKDDQYGQRRERFQEDRTSQDQTLEYEYLSEGKRQDAPQCPGMNIPNPEEKMLKSEMNNKNPDNQEHSDINTVTKEEEQPFAIDGTTVATHSEYRATDRQDPVEEGLCPNMDMKNSDDDMPCLAMNRNESSGNPRSIINRQDSSENPRSIMNRQYSVHGDHNPVMNTKNSEDDQLESMEGEALRADELYPVLQRQYSMDEQQRPPLQRQNSIESEQYSVVDGLKIRDSFDLYDRRISSPSIESAYGDRLSLPRDLQDLTLSDESKAEIKSQTTPMQDHYKCKTESTSPSTRVSKIGMPFSIVDTFDVDTNEDKRSSKGENEISAPINDQSDPVASSYPLTQTSQESMFAMKSEVDKAFLDSGNRVVGKSDETMIDELSNRMEYCQLHDPPGGDINNDENGSYFNTPPSFYPYSSPTPPQWGPSASEDSDNLQYKTFDSKETLNQNNTTHSNDNGTITDTKHEENLYKYESSLKDEDGHREKNSDGLLQDDKKSFQLTSEFQSTSPFDKTYGERSSSDITTSALYTKGYQSIDGQEHEYTKEDIPDSSVVAESDSKKKETREELHDATFPEEAMKPEENPDAISLSHYIGKTERTTPSLSSPQSVEKLSLSTFSKIDDGKLLNKRRRQRRRTKSTTSSDGESQVFLDFTDGNLAEKSESSAKSATSAKPSMRDGLVSTDAKVKQDDSKELQSSKVIEGQIASPVEAFTFAHNPEKSADLDQQSKKRFQKSAKKSKSRRKSDPRDIALSLSLDDEKDMKPSTKKIPASGKPTEHPVEECPSLFPEASVSQKEDVIDTLEKSPHATAAGLCKETDKSIKQRQGSPMVKRKPRGYELKRASSLKTYIREINEESIKSETSISDLSRSLEASSEPIPAPRQYIPSTASSSMPSQLPQPSVHAPRNLFTDSLQARSSTPPNVGQDQMHTPGHLRSVLRPSTQSRKIPIPSANPSTLFLDQSKGLQGAAQTSQEEATYSDSNRHRRSSPAVNTQEDIDEFSPLNRSGKTTTDKGDVSVAPPTGAEAPQQQQQLHAPEEWSSSSRQTPATSESTGVKKMRRRRRR